MNTKSHLLLLACILLLGGTVLAQPNVKKRPKPELHREVVVNKVKFRERIKNEKWQKWKPGMDLAGYDVIAIPHEDNMVLVREPETVTDENGNDWIISRSQTITIRLFENKLKVIRCSCPDQDEDNCVIQWNSNEGAYQCANDICCEIEVFWEREGVVVRQIQ